MGFRRASARILANPKKRSAKRVGSCPMFACLQQEAPGGTHIFGFRASRSAYNWRTVCASCGQLLCCRQSPNFNNVFQGSGFFLGLLREQTWNVRCQSPKNDCFPMCITAGKGYGLIAPLGLCIETDRRKEERRLEVVSLDRVCCYWDLVWRGREIPKWLRKCRACR